jgi:hypothetical protein
MSAARLLLLLLAPHLIGAAALLSMGPAFAESGGVRSPPPCPDYGSFVAVDPSPRRGAIVARSYNDCADLPDSRPRDPIHLGAEAIIGGQQQDSQTAGGQTKGLSSSAGRTTGQAGSGQLQLPTPAPVWRVTPGLRRER